VFRDPLGDHDQSRLAEYLEADHLEGINLETVVQKGGVMEADILFIA